MSNKQLDKKRKKDEALDQERGFTHFMSELAGLTKEVAEHEQKNRAVIAVSEINESLKVFRIMGAMALTLGVIATSFVVVACLAVVKAVA